MKLFIKKIFIFFVFLIFLLSIKKIFLPYNWGNFDFNTKLDYYIENKESQGFNTIFWGSSRIYRHVNCLYFDSLLSHSDIKSFNISTPATFNPETFFLYENFIEKPYSKDLNYAFIEIQDLKYLDIVNLKTTKATYWNNFYFLNYSINYSLNSGNGLKYKSITIASYLISFFNGLFDFEVFRKPSDLDKEMSKIRIGINGFYPLDEEIRDGSTQNGFYKRWFEFNSDTTELTTRIEGVNSATQVASTNAFVNQYYLNYLNKLIKKSKKKGINLVFILPPRLKDIEYLALIPIANSLPPNNIIKLHDPDKFKDLYLAKNSFDIGHLNAQGANIFTYHLAEEFKKISIEN